MPDQPVRSQSSLYFERYAHAQRQNISLGMTVYLLGFLCALLVVGLIVISIRPKAIYYIPSVSSAGTAYPDRVPSASVISFAQGWLMDWVNYTPETVQAVCERSIRFMAPSLLSKVRAGMGQELERIARSQASSVFSLRNSPQVKESAQGFEVVLEGYRAVYAGKEELTREEVLFEVHVQRAPTTVQNPYGLVIDDVQRKRMGHENK
jgi:hypothetical protein